MKDKKLIICLVIVALMVAGGAIYYFTRSSSSSAIVGNFNCKSYSGMSDSSSYKVSLRFNKDNTFVYGPYNDLNNNHYKGTYTYEKEDKNMNDMDYYMVTFKGTELMENGKVSDQTDFHAKMEFAMARGKAKKEGIVIFTASYNMYYCYEE